MKIKIGTCGAIVFCILALTSFSFAQDLMMEKYSKDVEVSNEARLSLPLLITYAGRLDLIGMHSGAVKIFQAAKTLAEVVKEEVLVSMSEENKKSEYISYLDSIIGLINTSIDCSGSKGQGESFNTCYNTDLELDQKIKSYNDMFKDFEKVYTYNVKK